MGDRCRYMSLDARGCCDPHHPVTVMEHFASSLAFRETLVLR
jgi:hypothetical protein